MGKRIISIKNYVIMALAAAGISCASPGGRIGADLFESTPGREGNIRYLSKDHSPGQYAALKSAEGARLRDNLRILFKEEFAVLTSKYINMAHRCGGRDMEALLQSAGIFLREIYPKYFTGKMKSPVNVVYFRDREEFVRHTGTEYYGFFGPGSSTFYTYCTTGNGTLWHELTHAFIHGNAKTRPQYWFDEGLASFYVLIAIENGKVTEGYANWRMEILKNAAREGRLVHLREMFLDKRLPEDPGFSQARLFFCYLWIHGKMVPFVKNYLEDLLPVYRGEELSRMAMKSAQLLMGKSIDAMNGECLELVRSLKNNQKLHPR